MKMSDELGGFVETYTSQAIAAKITIAKQRSKASLIIGVPGVGKSMTINRFASEHANTFVICTMTRTGSVKHVLEMIIEQADLYSRTTQCGDMLRSLEDQLTERHHFIFDEAQHMDMDAMRTVLHLHEVTGAHVGFVGNPNVNNRKFVRSADFAQISDRFGEKLVIDGVHSKDIDAIAMSRNVTGIDAFSYLREFGRKKSLRTLINLLDDACQMAGARAPITLNYLREAARGRLDNDEERGLFKMANIKAEKAA